MNLHRLPYTCSMVEIGAISSHSLRMKRTVEDIREEIRDTMRYVPKISRMWFDEKHEGKREATVLANFNSFGAENVSKAFLLEGFKLINRYAGFHGYACETWMKTVVVQRNGEKNPPEAHAHYLLD